MPLRSGGPDHPSNRRHEKLAGLQLCCRQLGFEHGGRITGGASGFRSSAGTWRSSLSTGQVLASLRERSESLSSRLYPFHTTERPARDDRLDVTVILG